MWWAIDWRASAVNAKAKTRKKLIEVALPLDAINFASAHEKSIRQGHPSTLHLWWARRPLAAARAVIFAQMVDDPSSWPDLFPNKKAQDKERRRLFRIIEELVKWENTNNEKVLQQARDEIWQSWRRACADNADHPRAQELFDRYKLPAFHDPFAGGGALPLEAQRLGLEAHASDLNPVAVLINKAMIEIPPKFAGKPPVNPEARPGGLAEKGNLIEHAWTGAKGLAEDVRYYGQWMRDEAEKRIGHLYPQVEVTLEMVRERPDLERYKGRKLTVIAWIWARTVKSPNPAFSDVDVPLVTNFMLSTKKGKEAYVEPVIEGRDYRFKVKVGTPENREAVKTGTSAGKRRAFLCLMSRVSIPYEHIRSEGKAKRMSDRLMAVVAEGDGGRVYLSPLPEYEEIAHKAKPTWRPDCELPKKHRNFQGPVYGLDNLGDLYTKRQLVTLATFSDLVADAMVRIKQDATTNLPEDKRSLRDGGIGREAYAEAVGVYLSFVVSKQADLGNSLCGWEPVAQCPRHLFSRQAIPMVWDYAEGNPLGNSSGAWTVFVDGLVKAFSKTFESVHSNALGHSQQSEAGAQDISRYKLVSTDPPYYDNISYADLSDFFYVWLRRSLRSTFPELFATLAVPKIEELVATQHRHGSKEKAETFFLTGMTNAMHRLANQAHTGFPVTIYYAFKQSETKGDSGTSSTGWETFLAAVIKSGLAVTGTWPLRTENRSRMVGQGANALASSIVLVCRKRSVAAPVATRREFTTALRDGFQNALTHLQSGNIAPVDLAQAAIGPGMAVFTRYANVLDAAGRPVTVRDALALINEMLDEALAEQEGDFDPDSRWALAWFEQHGFGEGEYGVAETLSKAKNTSIAGIVEGGILIAIAGKVRLLRPEELANDWDPATDDRLTVWESVHRLIRAQETGGEEGAARLVARLGARSDAARELAYRLYAVCERKNRATEALSYNSLVQSWPEITRLSQKKEPGEQESLFDDGDI